MYKDNKISQQKCQKYFLSMCDVKVFLTFTFVVKILQVTRGCNRNYSAILATLQITSYALGV